MDLVSIDFAPFTRINQWHYVEITDSRVKFAVDMCLMIAISETWYLTTRGVESRDTVGIFYMLQLFTTSLYEQSFL